MVLVGAIHTWTGFFSYHIQFMCCRFHMINKSNPHHDSVIADINFKIIFICSSQFYCFILLTFNWWTSFLFSIVWYSKLNIKFCLIILSLGLLFPTLNFVGSILVYLLWLWVRGCSDLSHSKAVFSLWLPSILHRICILASSWIQFSWSSESYLCPSWKSVKANVSMSVDGRGFLFTNSFAN